MPTYGYECKSCKEQFETIQRITEDPLKIHDGCGGELRRLLYPVGIVFKGPGFYVNDYAKQSKGGQTADKTTDTKPEAKIDSATDRAEAKPESKTEAKAESKPESAPASAAPGS